MRSGTEGTEGAEGTGESAWGGKRGGREGVEGAGGASLAPNGEGGAARIRRGRCARPNGLGPIQSPPASSTPPFPDRPGLTHADTHRGGGVGISRPTRSGPCPTTAPDRDTLVAVRRPPRRGIAIQTALAVGTVVARAPPGGSMILLATLTRDALALSCLYGVHDSNVRDALDVPTNATVMVQHVGGMDGTELAWVGPDGAEVPFALEVHGDHATLIPDAPLTPGAHELFGGEGASFAFEVADRIDDVDPDPPTIERDRAQPGAFGVGKERDAARRALRGGRGRLLRDGDRDLRGVRRRRTRGQPLGDPVGWQERLQQQHAGVRSRHRLLRAGPHGRPGRQRLGLGRRGPAAASPSAAARPDRAERERSPCGRSGCSGWRAGAERATAAATKRYRGGLSAQGANGTVRSPRDPRGRRAIIARRDGRTAGPTSDHRDRSGADERRR